MAQPNDTFTDECYAPVRFKLEWRICNHSTRKTDVEVGPDDDYVICNEANIHSIQSRAHASTTLGSKDKTILRAKYSFHGNVYPTLT